jgi:hypothetical protein
MNVSLARRRSSADGVVSMFPSADGEDYGAGSLPYLEITDGALGDGRKLGHGELLQAELDAFLAARDDVQKVDYEGLRGERGEPPSASQRQHLRTYLAALHPQ